MIVKKEAITDIAKKYFTDSDKSLDEIQNDLNKNIV